jgi:Regulatory subunit of type II PKA R-subunit
LFTARFLQFMSFAAEPSASVPPEFPEILKDLNRAILKAQPADILAFSATYFQTKLTEREGFRF